MELWAETEDAPGYWVSTDGRVCGPKGLLKPSVVKPTGYQRVHLHRGGGRFRPAFVHRAVLQTFMGAPPKGRNDVAHWNGRRTDNRLINLRWASRQENAEDRRRHGTMLYGEKHPQYRATCKRGHDISTPESRYAGGNCKACTIERARAHQQQNREARKAYMRDWGQKNRERVRTYRRVYQPAYRLRLKQAAQQTATSAA